MAKIMKKNIGKHWIEVLDKVPEFGQEVALYLNMSPDNKNTVDHYDFGSLKSVTMTEKGKQIMFLNREGKEVAASHWFYMAPPTKE